LKVQFGYLISFLQSTKSTSKLIHHHIAKRPHNYFMKKWKWYEKWHKWPLHSHAHVSILVPYLFVIAAVVLFAYKQAYAAEQTWDFTNVSDFVYDTSKIETNGTSARLKAQNYVDDAQTAALYHMDEINGTTISDSSSNNNNGAVANATFGIGNLNNALLLNGTTSYGSVPDSSSLSLTQKNTLEAWTKLNSSFSSGSSTQRQAILDKGDYQLYYDNETGKVAYELADKNASSWSLAGGNDVNGSWDVNGKRSVNAQVKIGSDIYVGIGIDVGDAEVWKWNGSVWTLVGGGASSVGGSWDSNTYEGVYTLATDGTNLYAGIGVSVGDAEVWRWNGSSWTKIGGDSAGGSWSANYEEVWALDYFGGKLYAGLGSSASDAEVWSWDGSSWTKIGGDSINSGWTTNYEMVASLTNDNTNLYVGLGVTAGDAEVWSWDGSSWTKIGGDSINSGWDATIETVRSLKYFGGSLYAGTGDTAGDADIWRWNGSSWTKIGGDGVNSSWAASTYEQVGGFAWDGSNLYVGLGTGSGDGEVWIWNGSSWTKIGGDGVNSSWAAAQGYIVNTLLYDGGKLYIGTYAASDDGQYYSYDGSSWTHLGGGFDNKGWGYYGIGSVQVMQAQGGYLYAGTGTAAGTALVFRFDGTSWQLIGGQGINNSWGFNTFEQVMSMASYKGKLYVGLGISANDAEVWEWDGSTWTKIGGDSVNSGWTTNYEEVDSLAAEGDYLYAGLGSSANDAEVWRWNGTSWTKIGGDSVNSGWTTNYDNVYSLAVYNGQLVAGLGRSAGEGEVWRWSGSSWSKIGGDSINGSWGAAIESVESLMPYDGKLYAGIGNTAGDGSLWSFDGSAWTEVGGDDINSSWTSGTYEKVKTIAVYNGDIFAGLGNSAGDGEVWRLSSGAWTKIGGASINGGWTSGVEEIESFSPYKGKMYVGTGLSANADGLVWSWGNNGYLESTQASFDTNWHHIAATYDGTTMKLYIDGTLNGQASALVQLPDSSRPLLIGTSYGGREYGKPTGTFNGMIDELRISNDARSSFTTKSYSSEPQTITVADAVFTSGVQKYSSFVASETLNGGSINYQLSNDGGATWQYWNGSTWDVAPSLSFANSQSDVNDNIDILPISFNGLKWRAVLKSDGTQQVTLNSVAIQAVEDSSAPSTSAADITARKSFSGSSIGSNDWTNGSSPYFAWDAAADSESGIYGYCLYLGHDNSANLTTTKGLLGTSVISTGGQCQFITDQTSIDMSVPNILGTALSTSSDPYYLLVQAIDKAGNMSSDPTEFQFRFDNTPPSNPGFISGPSGFINTEEATLTWPTSGDQSASDGQSGLAGLQYKIGSSSWYGDVHDGSGSTTDLLANDGIYTTIPTPDFNNIVDGTNTVYFRTWDNAGNATSTYVSAALKINTNGSPSEPLNLSASPSTNTSNSFSFSWDSPASYVGAENSLNYCYTINLAPSAITCTYAGSGIRSLSSGPYATLPGANTLYIVAKDESGNINYSSYSSVQFSANTASPGLPGNVDIVDVSIKASSKWRLAITWDIPTTNFESVTSYKIYRSTDGTTFSPVGTSSSTTYIDAGLSQQLYYYRVSACDSTNNCSAKSTAVSMIPTGKFTEPASLIGEPTSSNITTKRAQINWSTDRASDSKIAIGTSSGEYSSAEIGNSDQISVHSIDLDNLAAGTTYYYVVKWTDVDGNIGVSQEYTFTTSPAPVIKEINTAKIGLSDAVVSFTSVNSVQIKLYYGTSDSFGGLQTINTSTSESSYTMSLSGLNDGTKYYYQISAIDSEGSEYKGNIFSFVTPQRPRISSLQFDPVEGEPTSTQSVTWTTNVSGTSTVTYGKVGTNGTDILDSELTTSHKIKISGLEDDSEYFLIAESRDKDGNLATSDRQIFRTALDTRPPTVSDVTIESSIRGSGTEARGQVIVSWKTDEPASSQVGYAEGSTATTFNNKTTEDTKLTTEHIVVLSNLPTSKVYSIQVVSYDRARNIGTSDPQTAIIGRANESVLTLILYSLQRIFGL
jgi:hypothetical protein